MSTLHEIILCAYLSELNKNLESPASVEIIIKKIMGMDMAKETAFSYLNSWKSTMTYGPLCNAEGVARAIFKKQAEFKFWNIIYPEPSPRVSEVLTEYISSEC